MQQQNRDLRCHPKFFRREIQDKRVSYVVNGDGGIEVHAENWKGIRLTLDDRLPTEGYYS